MGNLLPDGEINVLVNSNGVFVATNDPNPVRWIEVSPNVYQVANPPTEKE